MSEFLSEVDYCCRKQVKFCSGLIAWFCCRCIYSHQAPRFDCPLPSFHMQISCWCFFWRCLFLVFKSWLAGMQPCCVLIAAGRWIEHIQMAVKCFCETEMAEQRLISPWRAQELMQTVTLRRQAEEHADIKHFLLPWAPRHLPSSKFGGPAASSLPPHLSWLISLRCRMFSNSSKICGRDSCQVTKTQHSFPEMHNSSFFCLVG